MTSHRDPVEAFFREEEQQVVEHLRFFRAAAEHREEAVLAERFNRARRSTELRGAPNRADANLRNFDRTQAKPKE